MWTYSEIRRFYPYKTGVSKNMPNGVQTHTNEEIIRKTGGSVLKLLTQISPELDKFNTCAIRLSYAINRTNRPMENKEIAGVRYFSGADGKPVVLSADEMLKYLSNVLGPGKLIWNGRLQEAQRWSAGIQPGRKGMIAFDWQGLISEFGATGHVDYGTVGSLTPPTLSETGSKAFFKVGAMSVYMWELV